MRETTATSHPTTTVATIGDLCLAIAEGRLPVRWDGENYQVRGTDIVRWLRETPTQHPFAHAS